MRNINRMYIVYEVLIPSMDAIQKEILWRHNLIHNSNRNRHFIIIHSESLVYPTIPGSDPIIVNKPKT